MLDTTTPGIVACDDDVGRVKVRDFVGGVHQALTAAPADLLVEALAEHLAKECDLTSVRLLLVDYRLAALVPLDGGEPHTHPGSAAWRCFDRQAQVIEDGVQWLPLTVRGERLGVLRLEPAPTDQQTAAALADAATVLAHELAAARASTDRYLVASRTRRLTLAAEMQWELLPGRSRSRPGFSLAGQLEPAYAVRGDSFDWADGGGRVWLSLINGMGEGVAAATLTTLATGALRNARRAGLNLADQTALADQALYSHYRGDQYVSALLLDLDLRTGRLAAIEAGLRGLLVLREGEVTWPELESRDPLGMFDGSHYATQELTLASGDRIFLISDGVVDAVSRAGRYGEAALERFIGRSRTLSALDAVRTLLGELRAFVGGDLSDDAVVVCLDWTGPYHRDD